MRRRDWRFRVEHISECIERIRDFTNGLTFEDFRRNRVVVDGALHNLLIIGEAARHVPQHFKDRHDEVPWQDMISMRNFVVHRYSSIQLDIIWRTIQVDLPPLASTIADILRADDQEGQ